MRLTCTGLYLDTGTPPEPTNAAIFSSQKHWIAPDLLFQGFCHLRSSLYNDAHHVLPGSCTRPLAARLATYHTFVLTYWIHVQSLLQGILLHTMCVGQLTTGCLYTEGEIKARLQARKPTSSFDTCWLPRCILPTFLRHIVFANDIQEDLIQGGSTDAVILDAKLLFRWFECWEKLWYWVCGHDICFNCRRTLPTYFPLSVIFFWLRQRGWHLEP